MYFFSLLVAQEEYCGSGNAEAVSPSYSVTHTNVWACVRISFEQLRDGHATQIGRVFHDGRWTDSSNNSRHAELLSAVRFYGANRMQLGTIASARIGKGVKELPAIKGFARAVTLMWRPFSSCARIIETPCSAGCDRPRQNQ